MSGRTLGVALLLLGVVFLIPAGAAGRATLTLDNRSGEDAVVRLAGPTSGHVNVPNGTSQTVEVAGGTYRLFVRYGKPGRFSYTKGEAFDIIDNGQQWEEVTITLHKVPNGNYNTSPSSEAEFNRGYSQ